jgi:hypothetical protein
MDTSTGGVIVSVVDPVIVPKTAWTVVVPVPLLVARPPLLKVATLGMDDAQVTVAVRSCVLLSE